MHASLFSQNAPVFQGEAFLEKNEESIKRGREIVSLKKETSSSLYQSVPEAIKSMDDVVDV